MIVAMLSRRHGHPNEIGSHPCPGITRAAANPMILITANAASFFQADAVLTKFCYDRTGNEERVMIYGRSVMRPRRAYQDSVGDEQG